MKKHVIPHTALFLILLVLSALFCVNTYLSARPSFSTPSPYTPGHFTIDPNSVDVVQLNVLWEFYPDTLLYSDPPAETQVPIYTSLPHVWAHMPSRYWPSTGTASYRLTLDDCPLYSDGTLVLYLGDYITNFKVYINGQLCQRPDRPYSYNIFSILKEQGAPVEVVIEVRNGTSLCVMPMVGHASSFMFSNDAQRGNVKMVGSTLLIVFLLFLFFSIFPALKPQRFLFILGLLNLLLFGIQTQWVLGYLDVLYRTVPNFFIPMLRQTCELAILSFLLWMSHRIWSSAYPPFYFPLQGGLLTAVALLYYLGIHAMHLYWLAYLITALLIIFLAVWALFTLRSQWKGTLGDPLAPLIDLLEYVTLFCTHLSLQGFFFNWAWYCIPVFLSVLIMFSIYCFYRMYIDQVNQAKKLLELERYAFRSQTALLASQIQPHFLYNTLLTIQSLCKTDPDTASDLVLHFSDYLRHNIDFMNYSELIPFQKELDHINNFIFIQQARFGEQLTFISHISFSDFKIPPLSVQPIVENAVKYGVRNTLEGGTVTLEVWQNVGTIHILVKNTGPGFDPSQAPMHSLKNLKYRLETLLNASINITSTPTEQGGTTVEILIPSQEVI